MLEKLAQALAAACTVETIDHGNGKTHTLTLDPAKAPGDGHFHVSFWEETDGTIKLVDYVAEVR